MNLPEIENEILKHLYQNWLHGRGGSIYSLLPNLENLDEKEFTMAADDLEERYFIKGVGQSMACDITSQGILEAERRGLIADEILAINKDARTSLIHSAYEARKEGGRYAETTLDDVNLIFSGSESVLDKNAMFLDELGWIQFDTQRSFSITTFGRDSYENQLMAHEKKLRNDTFETMSNSYTVVGTLGEGGVGKVFEVIDQDSHTFALKAYSQASISREKVKRFRNEMKFLMTRSHPNLVRVIEDGFLWQDDIKIPFYVMPKYSSTLRKLMNEGIPTNKILGYFSNLLDGVEALHLTKTWHRDLKPENILYDEATEILLIADLGAAHFEVENLHTAVETKPGTRLANFEYAAPEQRRKGQEVLHFADIYALGFILNEMFTGRTPFGEGYPKIGESHPEFEFLDEIVSQMIRHNPQDRFKDIEGIKIRLKAAEKDFFTLHRVERLKNMVVPIGKVSDPLTATPIRVVGKDYDHSSFHFELSADVNEDWMRIFKSIDARHDGLYHAWPSDMRISARTISLDCTGEAQNLVRSGPMILELVRRYVLIANNRYQDLLVQRAKETERQLVSAQREKVRQNQQEILREEERQRILNEMEL